MEQQQRNWTEKSIISNLMHLLDTLLLSMSVLVSSEYQSHSPSDKVQDILICEVRLALQGILSLRTNANASICKKFLNPLKEQLYSNSTRLFSLAFA